MPTKFQETEREESVKKRTLSVPLADDDQVNLVKSPNLIINNAKK